MFYSNTFLARKGPLGVVWCAAHLQHKLRKPQYLSTNVPSTVERIMYPEVPIALRLSGHLLLGVVRIYSKQVDYLYEDCNEVRITINRVYTTVNLNLPNDSTHAQVQAVTLPEKFNLDTLELDGRFKDWGEDTHFKSWDDITMTEQIPTGKDPYIVITFDKQDLRDTSQIDDHLETGPTPMDDDVPHPVQVDTPGGLNDPSSSNPIGADDTNIENRTPQKKSPSIEIMRDAAHNFDFNNSPILPDRAAPDKFLEEQITKDKEILTPATEEMPLPDARFSSPHNNVLEEEQHSLGHLNSPTPFVHRTPEMEIRQSPLVLQQRVKRKRKQFFDEVTVLSNEQVKAALDDTSNILRIKRNCPSSSLSIWKHNNMLRLRNKDCSFEPFINGACADLRDVYKEDIIIPAKLQLDPTQETNQDMTSVEIETLRNNECPSPDNHIPSFSMAVPSPGDKNYFTPENSKSVSVLEHVEATEGDGQLPTGDVGPSGNFDSDMQTPETFDSMGFRAEHTNLSDIPELVPSAGELGFLEQDDNSPAESQGTPKVRNFQQNQGTPELQALSSRTRAVAQYLQRQSSVSPIPANTDEQPEELSLNKILEGKPRKVCARMFFETLVLKTHGLVDARQETPYGDITLKVTPKLSRGKL
ncbi:Sister chromatid cohesion 1 protein 3 [Striga hermonthica]|uniref:Sister chromatid cohesion 1 protein 3 n=1 Tax=Striga hermonthica TaxID=68872 RepID=A0A9N7RU00_STRHE|nr:Sister chromatid cohesion 1 protein 3 [Striga hermonthica]